jgi:hypothetical protein
VRVYSLALNKDEIMADMHGEVIQHVSEGNNTGRFKSERKCGVSSDYEDLKIPPAAATLGVLVAIACVGFWPPGGAVACVITSLAAGLLLLLSLMPTTLPAISRWTMALVTLGGGASIAISLRRRERPNQEKN